MKKYKSSSISSKWVKNSWILKEPHLRKHIPKTMIFNKKNLNSMLSSYSTVYFKPTHGSGGANIIRIKRMAKGYLIQYKTVKTSYPSLEHLYSKLYHDSKKRSYLLQKGIQLAKTKGRPFDIRVMVQKTREGTWVSTGIFTKIGSPGKVATNYNQGGKIGFLHPTMSGAGYGKASIHRQEASLKRLGVSIGKTFDRHVKGFKELGLDVALDSKGKQWILEVNTRPQFYPLKNMRDKWLYNRMVSYGKQYGRSR